MLKFELTRFEAQDVITTSGVAAPTTPAPACEHKNFVMVGLPGGMAGVKCSDCPATGTYVQGTNFKEIEWSE